MKKAMTILLCAVLMGSLSACSGGSEPESSSIPSQVDTVIEDTASDFDYVAMAEDVGPIAASVLWEDPSEIPVRDLLGWYVRCVLAMNADDPSALDGYRTEGSEDYQIPAAEFEEAVKTYFGLEKERLEVASDVYNSEAQIYTLSPSQLPQVACTVQQVQISGENLQIYFTLSSSSDGNSGSARVYALTVDTSDGIRFVSCIEADSSELASGEAQPAEENEEALGSASESELNAEGADGGAAAEDTSAPSEAAAAASEETGEGQ